MYLAPPPVSMEVCDDVKLHKHAGPEGYAVVIARSKKSKKGVDRIAHHGIEVSGQEVKGGRAATAPSLQTDAGQVAAFHM